MKKTKSLNLTDFLSVGEDNAITSKDLARLLGLHERDITICVNALRKQGEFICSSGNGFWLPSDDKDIRGFVRQMESRIADMQRVIKPALDYLKSKNGGDI